MIMSYISDEFWPLVSCVKHCVIEMYTFVKTEKCRLALLFYIHVLCPLLQHAYAKPPCLDLT